MGTARERERASNAKGVGFLLRLERAANGNAVRSQKEPDPLFCHKPISVASRSGDAQTATARRPGR